MNQGYFNYWEDELDSTPQNNKNTYGNTSLYGNYYGSYGIGYSNKFFKYNTKETKSIINPDISYWEEADLLDKDFRQIFKTISEFKDSKSGHDTDSVVYSLMNADSQSHFPGNMIEGNLEGLSSFQAFANTKGFPSMNPAGYSSEQGEPELNIKEKMCLFIDTIYEYTDLIRKDKGYAETFINSGGSNENLNDMRYKSAASSLTISDNISEDEINMIKIDFYKNFYNKSIEFDVKEGEAWWFKLLSNMDNYMLKMISNGSKINSTILANNFFKSAIKSIYEYIKQVTDSTGVPPEWKDELGNSGGEGQPEMPQALKDCIASNQQQAMDDSLEEIKDMENMMSSLGIDPSKANDTDLKDVKQLCEQLQGVKINKHDIEKFIKSSIKSFNSCFRGHRSTIEESLFESEEIEDFADFHLLSNEALYDDMSVINSRYSMKYDIYVDCSGSMDADVLYGEDSIKRIILAKILAFKMNKMNLIGDVYGFEGNVYKINDIMNEIDANGGTCIDNCIKQIRTTGRPSIILSDGDDRINEYDENAFLFTISNGCTGKGLITMIESNHAMHYDNGSFYKYKVENNKPKIDFTSKI